MGIKFTMVGNLSVAKDSDKHRAFEDKLTDKGGIFRSLKLNMKSDKDFFSPQIKGFLNSAKKSDGAINVNDSDIYSLEQDTEGKYNSVKFKYKDKEKHMKNIAEFKKMVFVNDNERYEFCNEFDYSEFVYNELTSGKFDNAKFRIIGEIEYTSWFNEKTNQEQMFTNYSVNRIYVVPDDTEEEATANIEMYITEDCINEDRLEEENLLVVDGYIPQYDSKKKADIGFYKSIEYPLNAEGELAQRKLKVIKKLLLDNFDENQLCKIGFKVDLINRREQLEFDESMLSDDEKEMVELGLMDMKDLEAQYGLGMGNRIEKMSVNGIGRGYSKGAIPVELTIEQLMKKADEEKPKQEINVDLDENSDDDLDIFADDDLLPF
ncbi:MAG: hypothetical protein ACLR4X_05060 [Clostridia bacterium]